MISFRELVVGLNVFQSFKEAGSHQRKCSFVSLSIEVGVGATAVKHQAKALHSTILPIEKKISWTQRIGTPEMNLFRVLAMDLHHRLLLLLLQCMSRGTGELGSLLSRFSRHWCPDDSWSSGKTISKEQKPSFSTT